MHGLAKFDPLHGDLNRRVPVERIALVRLQPGAMFSGLQFSSLIRGGFGVCLELSTFLGSSRSALLAENLFLREQLAFYQERQIRPGAVDRCRRSRR
jgi:hypothetical protein